MHTVERVLEIQRPYKLTSFGFIDSDAWCCPLLSESWTSLLGLIGILKYVILISFKSHKVQGLLKCLLDLLLFTAYYILKCPECSFIRTEKKIYRVFVITCPETDAHKKYGSSITLNTRYIDIFFLVRKRHQRTECGKVFEKAARLKNHV